MDLIDDERDNIVLHVDARYDWYSSRNILVLNSFKDGSWAEEIRPSGFDFSPKQVNVVVSVGVDGFDIYTVTNAVRKHIAKFPFRLPLESVNRIRVTSEGNYATSYITMGITYIEG